MKTELRNAAPCDAGILIALENELFPNNPWGESAILSHLSGEFNLSLILEENGIPVGYLLAGFCPPEGELYRIAVKPDSRCRGFGGILLDEFFSIAKSKSVEELFLEVRESNLPAIALYEKKGFGQIDRRKNYYKNPCESALILSARLTK